MALPERHHPIRLGSKDYTDDKDPGEARRKHKSNFIITLNTNRKIGEGMDLGRMAQEGNDACKAALDFLSRARTASARTSSSAPKGAHTTRGRLVADKATCTRWSSDDDRRSCARCRILETRKLAVFEVPHCYRPSWKSC